MSGPTIRPIDFVGLSFFKLLIHSAQRFGGSGKKNHPTGGSIQPMNYTQKYSSRLVVFFFDVGFDFIDQGFISRLITLNQITGDFVDRDKMIVFV
jgi:hypothetical protein